MTVTAPMAVFNSRRQQGVVFPFRCTVAWLAATTLCGCLARAGTTDEPIELKGYQFSVGGAEFSPDGKSLLGSGAVELKIWDVANATISHDLTLIVKPPATYSSDGKVLAVVSRNSGIALLDVNSMRTLSSLPEKDRPRFLAFVPDSSYLVAASQKAWALWDTKTSQPKFQRAIDDKILSMALSPDGRQLATGSDAGVVRFWHVDNGTQVNSLNARNEKIYSVVYSPNGKMLASASTNIVANSIEFWDVKTRTALWSLNSQRLTTGLAFSPDGKLLASTHTDRTVKLWNTASGELVRSLSGHKYELHCVAFSRDGSLLATGAGMPDAPGELFLWNLKQVLK